MCVSPALCVPRFRRPAGIGQHGLAAPSAAFPSLGLEDQCPLAHLPRAVLLGHPHVCWATKATGRPGAAKAS